MDYKTKATTRTDLRRYSKIFRKLFDVEEVGAFPVLEALDKVSDIFKNCNYIIVNDNELPANTMARCIPNDQDGFTIEIKDSVYMGAYDNNNGALRGFICHEICHIFLFKIGFVPTFDRAFKDNEIPAYCSVEWQAKALCGEVMIPFEESKGLSVEEIIAKYHVSQGFAKARRRIERK